MNWTFTFSEPQINLVLAALAELPYKQVAGLIQEITKQAKAQVDAPSQPVVAPGPKLAASAD